MHPFYGHAAAPQGGAGDSGAGGSAGSSLLHSALYGARSGSGAMQVGTALYRTFNAPPRDKSILAAAVDDALMSPEADLMSSAAVDQMAVDPAGSCATAMMTGSGGVAAEVLADFSRSSAAADSCHRLNLGVVNLASVAAPDPTAAAQAHSGLAQQQPPSKAALYGNYQQARAPLSTASGHAAGLYGGNRSVAGGVPAGGDTATVQGLRRYTAAQLHQLSVVRQIQLRQQAAAVQQTQTQSHQQAQVLAAAAEVAQQVAVRNAAAVEQQQQQQRQQQQQQHHALRAAAEQHLIAAATACNATAPSGSADAAGPGAQSALYKRMAVPAEATSVLYNRPALGSIAAAAHAASATAVPAAGTAVSALYGTYCSDRHAASSAASAVASEVLQRLGAAAAASIGTAPGPRAAAADVAATAAGAAGNKMTQSMSISPNNREAAFRSPANSSHCSETAFLDCHEDLGDEAAEADQSLYVANGAYSGYSADGSFSGGSTTSAAATAAAAAGAYRSDKQAAAKSSARPYGRVYCPTVYTDVSSPHALALANDIMGRIRLPGGIRFMPVSTDSMLYYNGIHWGFSAFALALGSSYFQRLVEVTPTLNAAVRHAPPFAPYAVYMLDGREGSCVGQSKQQPEEYLHKDGLRSILFTCAYLATKVVDRMPHTDMLRRMLTMLYNVAVSREEAHSVELKCLEGLGYRLGPYFMHNLLEEEPPCCDVY